MMMVVGGMAVDLHLNKSYRLGHDCVKFFVAVALFSVQNGAVRMRNTIRRKAIRQGAVLLTAFSLCSVLASAQEAPWERARNASASYSAGRGDDRIDINHATPEQLLRALGMTPVWAARVVRYRPYRTKLDLLDRGILPSATYDHMKETIVAHRDETVAHRDTPMVSGDKKKSVTPVGFHAPEHPSFSW